MSVTPRSWASVERDDPQQGYPSPLTLLVLALLFVLALGVAAMHDVRCTRWAGDDPQRAAACEELRR